VSQTAGTATFAIVAERYIRDAWSLAQALGLCRSHAAYLALLRRQLRVAHRTTFRFVSAPKRARELYGLPMCVRPRHPKRSRHHCNEPRQKGKDNPDGSVEVTVGDDG
jgi:hypothetical protein